MFRNFRSTFSLTQRTKCVCIALWWINIFNLMFHFIYTTSRWSLQLMFVPRDEPLFWLERKLRFFLKVNDLFLFCTGNSPWIASLSDTKRPPPPGRKRLSSNCLWSERESSVSTPYLGLLRCWSDLSICFQAYQGYWNGMDGCIRTQR